MMKTTLLAVVVCFIGLTTITSVSTSTNTTSVSTNATSPSTPTNATSLSTSTNTSPSTSTNTSLSTPTKVTSLSTPTNATSLSTSTNTSLSTSSNTSPSTSTNTSLSTSSNTSPSTPTNATSLSTPTNTSPSTSTNTSLSTPTNATTLSTSTNTPLSTSSNTSLSTPTNTSPSTSTNTSPSTSTNTSLSTSTSTSLSTPTNTSPSTSTNTPLSTSSNTSLSTPTNTSPSTSTNTSPSTSTNTSLSTSTSTSLSTPTNTSPSTSTNTSLSTSSNTSPSTSTNTSLSISTNTTYVSASTDTASVSASTSASKTIMTPPPPSMSPHPGKAYFNLGFSLKINATFSNDLKNVTSSEYANYSKAFKEVTEHAFDVVPGFSHIVIKGFRNGSIICDYTAVITATAKPKEVLRSIKVNDTVIKQLHKNVGGKNVDSKYLGERWIKDLKAAEDEMKSICNAENICDIGYKCIWTGNRTTCTSNCEGEDCGDHGVCQFKADGQPICRCQMHPKYVYSGDKCEIKGEQLLLKSEYIAAIAGGGGGGLVLILVIALICTCVRKRKAKEKRDGPLSAYDESPGQHWTSNIGDPHRHDNPAYEAMEMDVLPRQRAQHGSGEEPFYVYQPSNITKPMTRASAEYASFMDEGRTGAAHYLPIKNRADTNYINCYGHDERHNTGEGAVRDAGHVPASVEADIIDDVRRHDRMRQAHDRTGPGESSDANRVSVAGHYAEITKHPRESISITPNTPQMQIENSKLDRREQDGYPSRDHRGQDDEQSRGRYHHGQDVYPSRDHLRRVDSPSLDRREQEGFQSRDQRGQDSYIPRDRNLERLHREERMSDRQRESPGSFRGDRRSPREADYGHQPAHPSPVLRQKGLGEIRHPHSFITIPEPDYGVDHGSVTEHDRHRPGQWRDNDAREGRQLYRNESHGNVNDSPFARDLQRRRTEIKFQGQGVMDRMSDTRDRRGPWENSDRRNENLSRHRR